MRIEEIDPFDDAALTTFHQHEAAVAATDPDDIVWTLPELRVTTRADDPWMRHLLVWGRDDDGMLVASAHVELPQRDNLETAWADVRIAPERRSEAGPFLEALKDRVRLERRSILEAGARWAPDAEGGPDAELLRAHGFRIGIVEAHRVLDLPGDLASMASLGEEVAPYHRDYTLRSWVGRVPDDVVDAFAAMRSVMLVEAPSGEMDWEAEDFPPERVRREEAELVAQERTSYTTVAVHDHGVVAGFTQIVVPGTDPDNVLQWDTLVHPEHRGHRLGIAMKVRNHLQAAPSFGARTRLHTWNAAENAPMVAVNEQLGFRLAAYVGEFRCDL